MDKIVKVGTRYRHEGGDWQTVLSVQAVFTEVGMTTVFVIAPERLYLEGQEIARMLADPGVLWDFDSSALPIGEQSRVRQDFEKAKRKVVYRRMTHSPDYDSEDLVRYAEGLEWTLEKYVQTFHRLTDEELAGV